MLLTVSELNTSLIERIYVCGRGLHGSTQTLEPETRPGTRMGSDPGFIRSTRSGLDPVLLPWAEVIFSMLDATKL